MSTVFHIHWSSLQWGEKSFCLAKNRGHQTLTLTLSQCGHQGGCCSPTGVKPYYYFTFSFINKLNMNNMNSEISDRRQKILTSFLCDFRFLDGASIIVTLIWFSCCFLSLGGLLEGENEEDCWRQLDGVWTCRSHFKFVTQLRARACSCCLEDINSLLSNF